MKKKKRKEVVRDLLKQGQIKTPDMIIEMKIQRIIVTDTPKISNGNIDVRVPRDKNSEVYPTINKKISKYSE